MEPRPGRLSAGHSEGNIDTNALSSRLLEQFSFVSAAYLGSARDKKQEAAQSTEEIELAAIEWKG